MRRFGLVLGADYQVDGGPQVAGRGLRPVRPARRGRPRGRGDRAAPRAVAGRGAAGERAREGGRRPEDRGEQAARARERRWSRWAGAVPPGPPRRKPSPRRPCRTGRPPTPPPRRSRWRPRGRRSEGPAATWSCIACPPGSARGCPGRCWPRSARWRARTGVTTARRRRARKGRCSSCPPPGSPTGWTATPTASPTSGARTTRFPPRPTTCAPTARARAARSWRSRSGSTTTPGRTSPRSWPSPGATPLLYP